MSTEDIRAELMRRWRERVCDGNPDGAAVGDGAALLFMEMVMDAQELFTRSTFDRFTSIAQACNVVTSAAGMANRAPAVDERDAIAAGLFTPPGRNAETAAASLVVKPKLETATRSVTDFQRAVLGAVLGSINNSGATFSRPMVLLGAVHTAGMRLHELGLVGANAAGFYPLDRKSVV